MRKRSFFALHRAASLCHVCSAGLSACSSGKTAAPPSPPPEVGVVTLHPQPVTITTDLPGRMAAYRVAEVRPQVSNRSSKHCTENIRWGLPVQGLSGSGI
jgi:membrane fusion protein, multidrug efflux system